MTEINASLFVELALDLAASMSNSDRFDRLLTVIRKAINCDAIALLEVKEDALLPLAVQGLAREALGRRFIIDEHPRLKAICSSKSPLRFDSHSTDPDPYDGLLLAKEGELPVHACMGLPLYIDNHLMGVITLDSLTPNAFEQIPMRTLNIVSAISSASLKTAFYIKHLEQSEQHNREILAELTSEALSLSGGEIVGQSSQIQKLREEISTVAASDFTVLIEGETGVGKELVARNLHRLSKRKNQPLVHLNCASLPENLVESELFGHTKGAFTGADKNRAGKFQLADGGTLFLDEIGEMSLNVQSKLLRALQSGEIQPLGQDRLTTVDVRVIAATNRNLKEEVENGNFRRDLYHRLSVYPLAVPPLRERGTDILLTAGYFLEATARKLHMRQLKLSAASEAALLHYSWPGNVRELEHLISRAALKAKTEPTKNNIIVIQPKHLALEDSPQSLTPAPNPESTPAPLKQACDAFQKTKIIEALNYTQGNWTKAAQLLELDRSNLIRMAKRLNIRESKTSAFS